MRFMIIRKADQEAEVGKMPSEQLLAAMGSYLEAMVKAGVLIGGEGLHPTWKGAKVKFVQGKPAVIDGPFTKAKAEDFGPEFTPGLREQEERQRAQVATRRSS